MTEMDATAAQSTSAALWGAFATKAVDLGAEVERAPGEAAALELLAPAGEPAGTRGLRERFPVVAARYGPIPDRDHAAAVVVAAGVLAVAETGSVLLCEGSQDRGACFLAEHLWLLVPADQIVATLDAAIERLGALIREGARYAVLMSGPSRTADIERTLTIGVHGPQRLTIVAVEVDAERQTAGDGSP